MYEKYDPDFYFNGDYNWYYGNNLHFLDESDCKNPILVYTTGSNFNKIQFIRFKSKAKLNRIKFTSNIHEIIKSNCYNMLGVREKFEISFIKKTDINDEEYKKITKIENPIPFISGVFNDITQNQFCSLDVESGFDIWDCNNTAEPIASVNIDTDTKKIDRWGQLLFYDNNLFLHADRTRIQIMDTRISGLKTRIEFQFDNIDFPDCEAPASLLKSKQKDRIYLGTTHNLLSYDARFPSKNIKQYSDVRWSHLMSLSPTMIRSVLTKDNYEIIFAAGQLAEDIRICGLNIKNTSVESSLVKSIYSITDSYDLAKKQGHCINPTSSFHERVKQIRTGMDVFDDGNNQYTLLTHTAAGDIFSQKILKHDFKDDYSENFIVNKMNNFYSDCTDIGCRNNKSKCFRTSHYQNLKAIKFILNCKQLQQLSAEEINNEPIRSHRLPKWKRSLEELQKYKDTLAPGLLSIWDISPTVSGGNEHISRTVESLVQIDVPSKISDWLERTNEKDKDVNVEEFNFNDSNLSKHQPKKKRVAKNVSLGF